MSNARPPATQRRHRLRTVRRSPSQQQALYAYNVWKKGVAAREGFEPSLTAPKADVLPLHHRASKQPTVAAQDKGHGAKEQFLNAPQHLKSGGISRAQGTCRRRRCQREAADGVRPAAAYPEASQKIYRFPRPKPDGLHGSLLEDAPPEQGFSSPSRNLLRGDGLWVRPAAYFAPGAPRPRRP